MTSEEAIKNLQTLRIAQAIKADAFGEDGHKLENDFFYAVNMAIATLEKQMPKKPNAYHARFFGDGRMAYDCPNCKHCFTMMKPNYNDNIVRNQYCDICGQAIDWSEVD